MKLDQFLKWQGWTSTGGEAKSLIRAGLVSVNGLVETRRGRKLINGDQVVLGANQALVSETDATGS